MQIEEQIRQFILQNLYFVEDNSFSEDASFLETGVVDSMGVMELVAFIHSEFGVTAESHEVVVENFDSVRKLANFVPRHVHHLDRVVQQHMASISRAPTLIKSLWARSRLPFLDKKFAP